MHKNQYIILELDRFMDNILDDSGLVAMLSEHQRRSFLAHCIKDVIRPLEFADRGDLFGIFGGIGSLRRAATGSFGFCIFDGVGLFGFNESPRQFTRFWLLILIFFLCLFSDMILY